VRLIDQWPNVQINTMMNEFFCICSDLMSMIAISKNQIRQLRLDKLRVYSYVGVKNIKNSEVLSGEIVVNPRY